MKTAKQTKFKVEYSYSESAGAIYLRVRNRKIAKTVAVDGLRQVVAIDLDSRGLVVGIELIGVSAG